MLAGIRYEPERQALIVDGLVVRDLRTFPLAARPLRAAPAAVFDFMAGNSTLGIHLVELAAPGEADGHRHMEETTVLALTGSGRMLVRQADDAAPTTVAWRAGDLLSIPANAWHRQVVDPGAPARLLSFKSSRLLRKLFHDRAFNYENPFRFTLRYADEPGYFEIRKAGNYGKVRAHVVRDVAGEPLAPDADAGTGVAINRYQMGGHRLIDHAIVAIEPGGAVREHRPLAEEVLYILAGAGTTTLRADDGRRLEIGWSAGDLVAPPFGWWRAHRPAPGSGARWLRIGNGFIERVLGVKGNTSLDGELPVRDADVIEADRGALPGALADAAADTAGELLGDEA